MTVGETYNHIRSMLAPITGEAEAEAAAILAHVLGIETSSLHLRFLHECPGGDGVEQILEKRLSGMPLAYALGRKYFYGHPFHVDSRVLIPRWDSECVAERAIRLIGERGYARALDLCCGSGCLGLSLLLETDVGSVDFADISGDALCVAQENARRLLAGKEGRRAKFIRTDLFAGIDARYGLIISNPPYVSEQEYAGLDAQIRGFEPPGALLAQSGGYAFFERIAAEAGDYLLAGGAIVLELGSTQQAAVAELLEQHGFKQIECGSDLAGRPRFVSAVWQGKQ